jgi:translation initiation factor IF-3
MTSRLNTVRVVGADGAMLGVLDTHEALRMAREALLDLVEVNPKAFPPVCKIMDFGKFKYEEKKRTNEAKKRQAIVELKELKLRPKTDVHDLEVKISHARRFLEEGNKVKITCRFRGREITHPEAAERQLHAVVDRTKDLAIVELTPRMEGRNMTLVMAPIAKAVQQRPRPAAPAAAPAARPAGPGSQAQDDAP